MKTPKNLCLFALIPALAALIFASCSTFNYKTYEEQKDVDDPEPNYEITLNADFQEYTSYMFIGNRTENFGTYFNTFFNARENFDEAYEDYETRVLSTYSERPDSIYAAPNVSQESKDKFNKSIEKASKVIQYHKSSAFMDQAVLLIGKCYFYLGDFLKAERKFSEFVSKLSKSPLIDEALLFLARTQMRLGNYDQALARLDGLIRNSKDKSIIAGSYQAIGEYYLYKKDYETSIKNYRSCIEYSADNNFKAQMQFLIASVTAKQNPAKGSQEFKSVLKYNTSFELEYLTRYNHVKYLILSSNFGGVLKLIEDLRVDYKEYPEYLSDIEYLAAKYYEQKKEYKTAVKKYKEVIINYPKTIASSDASFSIAGYYENIMGDYMNAYRYYRYSNDENIKGHNAQVNNKKITIFKKYFDLRSTIAGSVISTDYDSTFLRGIKKEQKPGEEKIEEKIKGKGEDGGKPGSYVRVMKIFSDSLKNDLLKNDSLKNIPVSEDSLKMRKQNITRAKFELAELFIYDIDKPDSAEKYLDQAYNESDDYDFKSKVMYALADLYRNRGREEKYEDILRNIVKEYALSPVADECRKLLNLPAVTENNITSEDSIFSYSENKFVSKEYRDALGGFLEIASGSPGSDYYAKSNYAAGWIYENILERPDSAYMYYTNLVKNAPASELTVVVAEKLTEYENFLNPVKNDSLTVDSNKTVPIEEKISPIENKGDDKINDNGEGTPQKDADIKKEDKNEGDDPTK